MEHLQPCLYILICKKLNRHAEVKEYMQRNSKLRDSKDPLDYGMYVHGYLIPHLQERRDKGELTIGKELMWLIFNE